eukprot:CAMPEP_0178464840 /NCGR_PEP_ID=MMETSP0689_2-20121128/51046_1 /TAXON_ID=160604 /ORGANISM="Amphidinium massartii, Strain CS-259" /LENGTH=146 /DNA_ID=CAMNT_0020091747 /DNA_START=99 /DNA_END=540 /DNA_ORIENTATION=+
MFHLLSLTVLSLAIRKLGSNVATGSSVSAVPEPTSYQEAPSMRAQETPPACVTGGVLEAVVDLRLFLAIAQFHHDPYRRSINPPDLQTSPIAFLEVRGIGTVGFLRGFALTTCTIQLAPLRRWQIGSAIRSNICTAAKFLQKLRHG